MIGEYETSRDRRKLPDCWHIRDDNCEPHFHSSLELTYVTAGSLTGWLNGQRYPLGPHEFLLSPSYSLHRYETPPGTSSASILLTVPTDFIPSFQKALSGNSFAEVTAALPPKNELLRNLLALEKAVQDTQPNPLLLKGYVYTMLGLLIELLGLSPARSGSSTDLSRDILLYMQDNYLQRLTPESAASHFGYSRSHFSHIFSQTFGFGFSEYLNILRCRHAAMLMLDQSYPLIDAAMNAGYENMRTFYRNFKQAFGMTPTEYLASQRIKNQPS